MFVPCISDHESTFPKVFFVAGQPRPVIRSLPHTDVTKTERIGWGEGLLCCLFLGDRQWWGTVVNYRCAVYNQKHPLLPPLPTLYPNLFSRGLGKVTGGGEVSAQEGGRCGDDVLSCI